MEQATTAWSLPEKVLAAVLAAMCLVLGAIGLVLPVIPGLLFIAVAAVIVVKAFPWLDARARKHRLVNEYLDRVDRLRELGPGQKAQLAGWLCLKLLLDSLEMFSRLLSRLALRLSRTAR